MAVPNISIFEVLDNYFGSNSYPNVKHLSERRIRDLSEHVITFYKAWGITPRENYETRLYLGAFLSSPPLLLDAAPYISSALLYSDSTILFDPLYYWFNEEQYNSPRLISAQVGWRDWKTRQPDYVRTRKFLAHALDWLTSVRPLIDSKIIVLVPAEHIAYQTQAEIDSYLNGAIKLLNPLPQIADKFTPDEITVDDNRKGMFVFAGGDREHQIEKWLVHGIKHFSRDIAISNATGSLYTAPFRWEQYLGKSVLEGFVNSEYESKTIESIRNLKLPILSKLSPEVLVSIHKDSGYTEFRAGLSKVLRNIEVEIGSPDFANSVTHLEHDILLPKVEAIYEQSKSSTFERLTNASLEGIFSFTQTFLSNMPSGLDTEGNIKAGVISSGIAFLRALLTNPSRSKDFRIWAQLLPEKPELSLYGSPMTLRRQPGVPKWDIDEKPSMSVKVSAGIFKSHL
jgi:hypothetical protein